VNEDDGKNGSGRIEITILRSSMEGIGKSYWWATRSNRCQIWGRQSDAGAVFFFQDTSVTISRYHCTNATLLYLIYLAPTVYNITN